MPASLVKISESDVVVREAEALARLRRRELLEGNAGGRESLGAHLRIGLDVDEPAELEQRPPRLPLELAPELVRPLREPDPVTPRCTRA